MCVHFLADEEGETDAEGQMDLGQRDGDILT